MRIIPRVALRTLTGAAILGFGALAFSPAPAAAHGYWGHRPHYGWYGPHRNWRPYVAPPAYGYRYYAPRPHAGYYGGW